jgi:uncharacterized FAD-dependent dehydrogenase
MSLHPRRLRIHQLVLPSGDADLAQLVANRLGVDAARVANAVLLRESVDGRARPPRRVASVEAVVLGGAEILASRKGDANVRDAGGDGFAPVEGTRRIGRQPIVVGAGPAGLFAALALARKGYRPLLIERGKAVRPRWKDVRRYRSTGEIDPESNVAFGEGGAGTFSDGKVYTRRNDPRNAFILEVLAEAAKAPDILTAARPHLGTNRLSRALFALRDRLSSEGVEWRFEARLDGIEVASGRVAAAWVSGGRLETDAIFLGTGHSARDVHELLLRCGATLEARPFAVGARIEHPQSLVDRCQYGDPARAEELGAASYMMAWKDETGERAAHTFCTCPGGEVVAASTEGGALTVNGMSYSHRKQPWCNSAIVVEVDPAQLGGEGPLAGVAWQRLLEERASQEGGGADRAPAQRVVDFMAGRASEGEWDTSYRLGVRGTDLARVLPEDVVRVMREAIRAFGRRIAGFDTQGHLVAVEARTTSPVRVVRDAASAESVSVAGLFPMGEGAGYAGGIVSAASDGLRSVERIAAWR